MKHLVLLVCIVWSAASLAETTLIKNGRLISGSRDAAGEVADIMLKGKRITAIGQSLTAPDGAEVIDADGKTVTAGFFNAETRMGIVELSAVDSTGDYSSELERVTASLRVADAINPASSVIPHNRMLGVTHVLVQPSSGKGLFAGTAAVIDLSSGDAVLDEAAAMVVTLGAAGSKLAGGSRAAAMALLREAIEDARDYRANRDSYNRGNRRDYALSRHDLAALGPVVSGSMPLLVHADRASDIRQILKFGRQQKVRLILSGVTEGWMVAEQLARQKVPVIIDPIQNLPSSYEKIGTRLDNAKLMHAAGVKLLFTGMGWQNTHNAFLVRQSAGNAVANGLPYQAAIQALTSNPSEVFGLNGYGDLQVGNEASLVIWSGDPLELSSSVEKVFIAGEDYPLVSRATRLRDRYWHRYRAED